MSARHKKTYWRYLLQGQHKSIGKTIQNTHFIMKDFIQGMWVPQNLRALPPYDIIKLLMPYHIMSCHLSLYCCIICDVISQNWARHNPHAKHRSFLRLGCRSVSTSDPVEIEGPPPVSWNHCLVQPGATADLSPTSALLASWQASRIQGSEQGQWDAWQLSSLPRGGKIWQVDMECIEYRGH